MSLATAIHTALTGVNVPKEQVREIVDTIENEMRNEFATKSDIALIRADLALVVSRVEKHTEMAGNLAVIRAEMKDLENRMIIKLGALMVILVGVLPKILSWLGW